MGRIRPTESSASDEKRQDADRPLLSVLMPIFDERGTIEKIVERVLASDLSGVAALGDSPGAALNADKELIMVDDGSTDGTREWLVEYQKRAPQNVRLFFHPKNRGKGAAVRTAISEARGRLLVIQDADLEYQPEEYPLLIKPILNGMADVVYGSRFLGAHRAFLGTHYLGNKLVTFVTNVLYNTCLTDMETCYKCFRREVFDRVRLRSDRFNIEPEITAKVFKAGFKLMEVPITYSGRDFDEGKKITWRDGPSAIWTLIKYRFRD